MGNSEKLRALISIGFLVIFPIALANPQSKSNGENANAENDDFLYGTFPEGFMWGLATSAYQIEGAWNVSGKGESNWDYWSHYNNGENIAKGQNGDVACDSYHKFREDTQLMKNMGAHFYRFSLSWARIVPTGRVAEGVNTAGIDHYNEVIDNLIEEGIQPFITLYHWDLPINLTRDGSWLNEDIVKHFEDYARIAFSAFGDRVKMWLTFNEPHVFCPSDWTFGEKNPFKEPPEKPYICAHNVVKAHALAYHVYDKEYRPTQKGKIGITLNCDWPEPKDPDNPAHVEASDRSMHFHYGWWANPLLRGEYPPIMREIIDKKSFEVEGRIESRLPVFDEEWTKKINGTLDFLGLNHYFSYLVFPNYTNTWLDGDADIGTEFDPDTVKTATGWPITPFGLRKVITWISREYKYPIYITENGYGGWDNDTVRDPVRVDFYKKYVNNVLKSIKLDGSDVRGYTGWSLLDNFEWASGYTIRFGLHHVNYTTLARTPKDSALYLKQVFADNGFPDPGGHGGSASGYGAGFAILLVSTFCAFLV